MEARGFYLSWYQRSMGPAELQAAWDAGYRYVHIRADSIFERHWNNAGEVGFLRSAWHYLTAHEWRQAREFYRAVGGRKPELGFYGDFEAHNLTIAKCDAFLFAADDWFGETTNYYTAAWWLNRRRRTTWEDEGRKLWLCSIGNEAMLPRGIESYEFWQHGFGRPEPFPCTVGLDRYNGTLEELYSNYGISLCKKHNCHCGGRRNDTND